MSKYEATMNPVRIEFTNIQRADAKGNAGFDFK